MQYFVFVPIYNINLISLHSPLSTVPHACLQEVDDLGNSPSELALEDHSKVNSWSNSRDCLNGSNACVQ